MNHCPTQLPRKIGILGATLLLSLLLFACNKSAAPQQTSPNAHDVEAQPVQGEWQGRMYKFSVLSESKQGVVTSGKPKTVLRSGGNEYELRYDNSRAASTSAPSNEVGFLPTPS